LFHEIDFSGADGHPFFFFAECSTVGTRQRIFFKKGNFFAKGHSVGHSAKTLSTVPAP
jgi:hypothetical protein